MISKLVEAITGQDDLERVAAKNDTPALCEYLQTRPVWIPQRPKRFLDAANFSEQELLTLIEKDSHDLSGQTVDLWILDMDGKKHLPIFSNPKKLEAFSATISKDLNKVFGLGCIQELLPEVLKQVDVEVIVLNAFSKRHWAIEIEKVKRS
jgi:hypothetical protein